MRAARCPAWALRTWSARQDEDGTVTCGWALLHALDHAYLHLGHVQITCQLWRQSEK